MDALLSAHELQTYLGRSHVLQGVSLGIGRGEVVSLLGRNGAGKTTTLRTLMGLVPARAGRVAFAGADISRWPTHRRARAGIAYVPQDRRMFRGLTVEENLGIARRAALRERKRVQDPASAEKVYALFPALAARRREPAGRLSGGEQRMLAIARALVAEPRLMLLDEPTDGLAPVVIEKLFDLVQAICASGIAILLAEQNARFAAGLASRGYIIHKGRIEREGSLAALLADEQVVGRHLSV